MVDKHDTTSKNLLVPIKIGMLGCLVLPYFWYFGLSGNLNLGPMLAIMVVTNLYYFVKIKSPLSVIFLIAHFNYLILYCVYFLELPFSYLEQQNERAMYGTAVLLDFVFYLVLGILFRRTQFSFSSLGRHQWIPANALYVLGVICVIVNLIAVYRFMGLPYSEYHDKHTSFNEVGWVLCSVWLLFDSENRLISTKTMFLYLLFIASVFFGARLQISFFVIALLIRFVLPYSKFHAYMSLAFFVFVGVLVGVARDVVGLQTDLNSVFSTINQGASLRTAAVFLMAIDAGFFNISDRILAAGATFLLGWVPSSLLENVGHLNVRITEFSEIQGNGGLIGSYLFFFFGSFGGFAFVALLGYLVRKAVHRVPILIAILIVTSYRWQLYNVIPVIKVLLLLLILSAVWKFLKEVDRKRRPSFIK